VKYPFKTTVKHTNVSYYLQHFGIKNKQTKNKTIVGGSYLYV